EAQLLRRIERVLVRTGDGVNPVHHAGHAAELAERSDDLAAKVHLVHAADAADVEHLGAATRHAERPRVSAQAPLLLERAFGVEHLDATVLPVGDVEIVLRVDHDRMRGIEVARSSAALAPTLHQVALLVELGDAGFAVAVGHEDRAVGAPGDIGRLVEVGGTRDRALDHVGRPGPRLRAPAEHHLHALLGVELDDEVGAGVDVPEIVLRIDAHAVRAFERQALPDRADKAAVRVEFQDRLLATVHDVDLALGIDV